MHVRHARALAVKARRSRTALDSRVRGLTIGERSGGLQVVEEESAEFLTRVSYRIFCLGGGKVCRHVSRKRINVGGSGASPPLPPQEHFFKFSFSEVDFSAILLCVQSCVYIQLCITSVKLCRCERE